MPRATVLDFTGNPTTAGGVTVTVSSDNSDTFDAGNGTFLMAESNGDTTLTLSFSSPVNVSSFKLGFTSNSGLANSFTVKGHNGGTTYTYGTTLTYDNLYTAFVPTYTVDLSSSGWGPVTSLTVSNSTADPGTVDYVVGPVTFTAANLAPTVTAGCGTPTFVQGATLPAYPFSLVTADTQNAAQGQTFTGATFTVSGVSDGGEALVLGGTSVALAAGSGSLASGGGYAVTMAGSTAAVTLTGMSLSNAQMGAFLAGVGYRDSASPVTTGNRGVTLTGVTDSGSDTNHTPLNLAATVTVSTGAMASATYTFDTTADGSAFLDGTYTGYDGNGSYSGTDTDTIDYRLGGSPSPLVITLNPTGQGNTAGSYVNDFSSASLWGDGGDAMIQEGAPTSITLAYANGATFSLGSLSLGNIDASGSDSLQVTITSSQGGSYTTPVLIANATADYTSSAAFASSKFSNVTSVTLAPYGASSLGDLAVNTIQLTNVGAVITTVGTSTSLSSNSNPSSFGASVTFTATVSAGATGTVTFKDGTTTLATVSLTGAASYTTTGLAVGSHSVTAVYNGDSGHLTSTSAACSETINLASQTLSFANPGTLAFGTTPTLTATGGASGNLVTFTSSTPAVATITPGGQLTFLTAGTATIQADQAGNNDYAAAAPVTQSFTVAAVAPGTPTSVTATAGYQKAVVSFTAPAFTGGAAITGYTVTSSPGGFTATGTASPITVTGLSNSTSYTFSVTASNGTGAAATSPASVSSAAVTTQTAQTITFANPGSQDFGTTPTLTATSDSNLAVTFTSANPAVATITSGGTLTFIAPGTASIHADQAGNSTYAPAATVNQTFTVQAVAPGAPTSVSATAGYQQAVVSFAAPGFTGGAAITGYTVTSSPGGFTATGAASPVTVTGLSNGTPYTFTVTATNAAALTGTASAVSNQVTPAASAPGSPTGVTAAAGNGQATVSFTPPAGTGGPALSGYTVTVSPGGVTATGTASPVTVTGLSNGTAYTFTVTASNASSLTGTASAASNPVIPSPGGTLLVVQDGNQADLVASLTAQAHQGNHLTVTATSVLPTSLTTLATYNEIWDLRSELALSSTEQTAYQAYLNQGGTVFLLGQGSLAGARDPSLTTLISQAGGGSLAMTSGVGTPQTVRTPFTGPIGLATVGLTGATGSPAMGTGAAMSSDGTSASALLWAPGTLGAALSGTLATVFQPGFMASAASSDDQTFLANLVAGLNRIGTWGTAVTGVQVPANGTYIVGQTLDFTLTFAAPVTVTGTPVLPITLGSGAVQASYRSGSGSTSLVFRYTVAAGASGSPSLGAALDLTSGASLLDAAGYPVQVRLAGVAATGGITVNGVLPAVPVITGVSGTTVSGTADPDSTVTLYLGGVELGTAMADGSGAWSYTLATNETGSLTAIATSVAGNTGSASTGTSVDTELPVAGAVTAAVAFDSSANPIALSLSGAAATAVAVASGPAHGTATASGTGISYTPARYYAGTDAFSYTASNGCGSSAAATVQITVGANPDAAPTITLNGLADGSVTSQVLIGVTGTVLAPAGLASLKVNGTAVQVAHGSFSFPVRLGLGSNTFTVAATDLTTQTTTVSRTVTLDVAAPVLYLDPPADGAQLAGTHLAASGSVLLAPGPDDTLASVSYSCNGGSELAATVTGTSFTLAADLAAGPNTLTLTAATAAGRTAQLTRAFTMGASVALAVVDPAQDQLVTTSTYVVQGTASASDGGPVTVTVTVTADGGTYHPTVTGGAFSQAVTFTTGGTLPGVVPAAAVRSALAGPVSGTYPVQVTVTDDLGQTASTVRNLVKTSTATALVFTLTDAQRVLDITAGTVTPSADDGARYDLAPRVNGVSAGDGVLNLEDAMLVLYLASGLTF